MESELDLIARCRAGDEDAWNTLFETYYSAAGRFIFQLSPALSTEDAEEICQEVFLSVVRHIGTFEANSSFQTWLFRIAINRTRDFMAKAGAAKRGSGRVPLSLQAEDPQTGLALNPVSRAPSPDAELVLAEKWQLLRQALDELGEPCREVIELKYFGDLSYDEIANALKLNAKTVSSRLSKCLDKLEVLARPLLEREKYTTHTV